MTILIRHMSNVCQRTPRRIGSLPSRTKVVIEHIIRRNNWCWDIAQRPTLMLRCLRAGAQHITASILATDVLKHRPKTRPNFAISLTQHAP